MRQRVHPLDELVTSLRIDLTEQRALVREMVAGVHVARQVDEVDADAASRFALYVSVDVRLVTLPLSYDAL